MRPHSVTVLAALGTWQDVLSQQQKKRKNDIWAAFPTMPASWKSVPWNYQWPQMSHLSVSPELAIILPQPPGQLK